MRFSEQVVLLAAIVSCVLVVAIDGRMLSPTAKTLGVAVEATIALCFAVPQWRRIGLAIADVSALLVLLALILPVLAVLTIGFMNESDRRGSALFLALPAVQLVMLVACVRIQWYPPSPE